LILSVGEDIRQKNAVPHVKEYIHSWSQVDIDYKPTASIISSPISTPITTTSQWPLKRWNFGYTVTAEGWFFLYGGEDATYNVHFDDAWVFYENNWLQLKLFNVPSSGDVSKRGPGRRKGLNLLVLPLSGLVILWGGQRPIGVRQKSSNQEENRAEKNEYFDEVNGVNSRGRGPYVQCLSDTYLFNASAALRYAVTGEIPPTHRNGSSNGTESLSVDLLEGWKKVADFPDSCLSGSIAVGVVDPLDGREKIFAFGGRYRIYSEIEGDQGYLLAEDIWLFDPISDIWTRISRSRRPRLGLGLRLGLRLGLGSGLQGSQKDTNYLLCEHNQPYPYTYPYPYQS
jgi:hypothetical protein